MLFFKSQAAIAFAVLAVPALALAQQPEGQQPSGTRPPATQQPGAQPPGTQPEAQPGAPAAGGGSGELGSFKEKLSYAIGLNAGRMLQQQELNPDPQLFMRGFQDSYKEGEALLTDQEIQEIFGQVQQEMQAKAAEAQKELAAKWDESFAQKPAGGEQKTESGIKYSVIAKGEGAKPKASDYVVVHYVGKLPDGETFDSSLARGEPAVFQLGQVIPGWTEGLQLMSKGAKYRFDIPAELAYGEEGNPPRIPANQNLIFEVELLDVMPADGAPGGPGAAGAGGQGAGGAGAGGAGAGANGAAGNRPQ